MSGLLLITGAAGSGKSAYAEELALAFARQKKGALLCYLATMLPAGEEAKVRIERHRRQRLGKGFRTVECAFLPEMTEERTEAVGAENWPSEKELADSVLLLEDLSNLLANAMFVERKEGRNACEELERKLLILSGQADTLLIVTNEIFSDGLFYEGETEEYREALGLLNRRLGDASDVLCEVISSIPRFWKGEEKCPI